MDKESSVLTMVLLAELEVHGYSLCSHSSNSTKLLGRHFDAEMDNDAIRSVKPTQDFDGKINLHVF